MNGVSVGLFVTVTGWLVKGYGDVPLTQSDYDRIVGSLVQVETVYREAVARAGRATPPPADAG